MTINIEIGKNYDIVFVDAVLALALNGKFTAMRSRTFKTTGRRWIMRDQGGIRSFIWENEIVDQAGGKLAVGKRPLGRFSAR